MEEGLRNNISWIFDLTAIWHNLPDWGKIVISALILVLLGVLFTQKKH